MMIFMEQIVLHDVVFAALDITGNDADVEAIVDSLEIEAATAAVAELVMKWRSERGHVA